MIYPKSIQSPALRLRSVRRRVSLFAEERDSLLASGLHFRKEGEALVCAEGAEEAEGLLENTEELFVSQGHACTVFGYTSHGILYKIGEAGGVSTPLPKAILAFEEGEETVYYLVSESGVYRCGGGSAERLAGMEGGVLGAVHAERLFVAGGNELRFSAPLTPESRETGVRDSGYVRLPSEGGNALALLSLGEKLLLVREHGLTLVTAKGDTLKFSAAHSALPVRGIEAGSVRAVGESAVFLTKEGLFRFGETAEKLSGCGFSEIDLERGVKSASCGGKYFAAVTLKRGDEAIWCVDPKAREGHFLRMRANAIAGGAELLFADGKDFYRLTERGMPTYGRRECTLETEPSLLGLSEREKFLDGVTVEGRGSFRVEARGANGSRRAVFGRAGERLRFPAPVRGTSFSFNIRTLDEDAKLSRLTFALREETGVW